jgi:hypothetical protein
MANLGTWPKAVPSKKARVTVEEFGDKRKASDKPEVKVSHKKGKGKAATEAAAEIEEDSAVNWAFDLSSRPDPSVGMPIVVIHPGSSNLRIGLSTAETPRVLPHVVAYRRSETGSEAERARAEVTPSIADADASRGWAVASKLEPAMAPLARQLRLATSLHGGVFPPTPPSARIATADEVNAASIAASAAASVQPDECSSPRILVGILGDVAISLISAMSAPGRTLPTSAIWIYSSCNNYAPVAHVDSNRPDLVHPTTGE